MIGFRSKLKLICIAIIACYFYLCFKMCINKLFSKLETVQVKTNSINSEDHMKIYDFPTYIKTINLTNPDRHSNEFKPNLDIKNKNHGQFINMAHKNFIGHKRKRILLYMTIRGGSSFAGGLFSTNEEIFYVFSNQCFSTVL